MAITNKAYYLLIGFFTICSLTISAQDQKVADSLLHIYNEGNLTMLAKMELLGNLAFNENSDIQASIRFSNELIELAEAENNYGFIVQGYMQKGHALRMQGELDEALAAMFKSAEAAIKGERNVGANYMSIADVYSEMGNDENAEIYYEKAIESLKKTNDSLTLASALFNYGDELFNIRKFDKALVKYEESGRIFNNLDYEIGNAYTFGNMGMVYAEQGKTDLAKEHISKAFAILEKLEDFYAISEYLLYMSDIYIDQNDLETAVGYAQRSLDLAMKYGIKKQISESNLKLSELYESQGNIALSHHHFKEHIVFRDSLINIEKIESMANQRTNFEVSQREIQISLLNAQKKNQRIIVFATAIALFLLGLLALGLYRRYRFIQKTKLIIETEKNRSENLLLNILPEETAQELKLNGKVKARKFDSVTVLFTDFQGFTKYAEILEPEKLVETVDYYFSKFDEIMETYKLEKIKTIGDAYMSAGGLHQPKEDHAKRMILAALDIVKFVEGSKKIIDSNEIRFDIRLGINTGPVVAGVVGFKKFAYDIWGDSVNIASRMESNGELNRVNISENTYMLVKDTFDCEYRGKVKVKNHGSLKMYYVNGLKEEGHFDLKEMVEMS